MTAARPTTTAPAGNADTDTTVEREVEVGSELGLHARPAAAFAEVAAGFRAVLTVAKGDREVDARSMLLLLTLDVRRGDRLVLRGTGDDAAAAVERLAALVTEP